ncbi:MAG: neutral/alkaline non-lysosomal ceramidase N-terminal domain-containing protein, partial [Victivallaceae bacterium]
MLKTGTSEKLITPETGIELCGYLARVQPSVSKYDNLYARVLYMENRGTKIIWIHCDLIGFANDIAARIRRAVAEKTAMKITDVFLSATHTHAGPATVRLRKCGEIDPEYVDFLERSIIEGAKAAVSNAETVTLSFFETTVENIAVDRRRPSKNSHVDNKLPVLVFRKDDGSFKAVIANYGMHNVGLSSVNRSISADIAGFAAEFAASGIPGKPTVFLTNGGCGNVNPATMTDDYSGVEKAGTILGNAVINSISNLKPSRKDGIESRFSEFELPLDALSDAQLE